MIRLQASKRRRRLEIIVFGAGARLSAVASQFLVLLLLGKVLEKDAFGDMMIVFALYRVLSFSVGTGLGNLVLVHAARVRGDHETDVRVHRSALLAGVAVSLLITLAIAFLSGAIAEYLHKSGLTFWLYYMSPMMIFGTLNLIAAGSLDGRSQITRSIVTNELAPNMLRLVGVGAVALLSLSPIYVATTLWGSLAVPWFAECGYLLTRRVSGVHRLSPWDVRYVGSYVLQSMGSMQLQGIDLLMVGYFYSSGDAADYALASRIAVFYPFFSNILSKTFTPHAAHRIHVGEISELQIEIDRTKAINAVVVSLNIAICLLLSAFLVMYFMPSYEGALKLVVLLATPQIFRALFFGVDRIMQVGDLAGRSALVQYISLTMLLVVSTQLSGWLGIYSVPIAMLLASVTLNPLSVAIVRSRFDLFFARPQELTLAALACALIVVLAMKLPAFHAIFASATLMGGLSLTIWAARTGQLRGVKKPA